MRFAGTGRKILRCHPAWRCRAHSWHTCICRRLLTERRSDSPTRLPFGFALRGPFSAHSLPRHSKPRLSARVIEALTCSPSSIYHIVPANRGFVKRKFESARASQSNSIHSISGLTPTRSGRRLAPMPLLTSIQASLWRWSPAMKREARRGVSRRSKPTV